MKIYSSSIHNGYLDDKFGQRGTQFKKQKPSRSFHLAWSDLPEGTKTLALIFIDYDAIPVCGFPWIHWTVANIDPTLNNLPENASEDMNLIEGVTSWSSNLLPESMKLSKEDASGYGGCAPPDKNHLYTLYVYALDKKLALDRGFYANELMHAMDGHVLERVKLTALYKTKN